MLNALPLKRDRAVFQLDLPYVRPVDALAALEHAVSPRTYDLSEGFTPLVSLTQFKPAFSGNRFRFRCPVGRPQPLAFDVDGEVIPLAVMAVFVLYSHPAYVLSCRQDLEIRLRELRPFLLSRTPP